MVNLLESSMQTQLVAVLAVGFIVIMLNEAVLAEQPSKDKVVTRYYTVNGYKALAHVLVDRNNTIRECYIFGGRHTVDKVLSDAEAIPTVVSKERFTQIRKACLRIQKQQIPLMITENADDMHAAVDKMSGQTRNKRFIKLGYELLYGIYPGTLWCGIDNIADTVESDDGLGENKKLDACCREHDHCDVNICGRCTREDLGGLFNNVPWTRSSCDCDQKFKECLKAAKDKDADIVGKAYFNIIDINCIEYNHPMKCIETSWFGLRCKKEVRDTSKPKEYKFYDQPGY